MPDQERLWKCLHEFFCRDWLSCCSNGQREIQAGKRNGRKRAGHLSPVMVTVLSGASAGRLFPVAGWKTDSATEDPVSGTVQGSRRCKPWDRTSTGEEMDRPRPRRD